MKKAQEEELERLKKEILDVQSEILKLEEQKIKKSAKSRGAKSNKKKKQIQAGADASSILTADLDKTISEKRKIQVVKELDIKNAELAIKPVSPAHQEPLVKLQMEHSPKEKIQKRIYPKSIMQGIYFFLSKLATRTQKNSLRQMIAYAGVLDEAEIWLGQILFLSFLVGAVFFMAFWVLFREVYIYILLFYFAMGIGITLLASFIHLNVQIEDRKKRLEDVLPDAMTIIAANVRAGMTPVVALRATARDELGPLAEDIKFATTKSLGTDSFIDALREMAKKNNSELFERIVSLFTASLRSGGHLAQLLENTAADIRQTQELKKDLIASTRLYAFFIIFTVAIGTPLLLAVSIQFSTMVSSLQLKTQSTGLASELSSVPLISLPLSIDFLTTSALVVLIITSLLASAMLGVITHGNYSGGLKYSPFIAVFSILLFYFLKDVALKSILPVG
jgi:Flp pilus assembly protein TadB